MARYNWGGQWTLQKNDEDLMFPKKEEKSHPLAKDFECDGGTKLKKGEVPHKPTNEEITTAILKNAPKQPTDEEMFGHLVPTEDQIKKAEEQWEDVFKNHFNQLKEPLEKQDSKDNIEWGNGKSFNSTLSPKELKARNSYSGE